MKSKGSVFKSISAKVVITSFLILLPSFAAVGSSTAFAIWGISRSARTEDAPQHEEDASATEAHQSRAETQLTQIGIPFAPMHAEAIRFKGDSRNKDALNSL